MRSEAMRAALDRIWLRSRSAALEQVAAIATAATALALGNITSAQRHDAERSAHKLAGAVGTFGFWQAATLAREAETLLEGTATISAAGILRLQTIVEEIRRELATETLDGQTPRPVEPIAHSRVVVIGEDVEFRDRFAADSRSFGMEIIAAETPAAARARIDSTVDAVIVDLTVAGFGIPFLEEIHRDHPTLRTIVISDGDRFLDRVHAARLGARGFLQKPVRPQHVIDLLRNSVLVSAIERTTIVVVDDDLNVLSSVREALLPLEARVVTVTDPTTILPVLGETAPDLVVLDVDMPQFDGIELCRVLRNDPRWAAVPVLFLTTHTDADVVTRMFESGADDFVAKPIVGSELVTRVRNRLERTRMLRLAADVDTLTGVATRRRGIEVLERFFKLAQRQRQPISIGAIDLDRFKQINDQYGHSVGDTVLRRAATILAGCFRGEDVVARWGGEEFVVGMYSMPCTAATRRLEQALAKLRDERFDAGGSELTVTYSAGVAEFPRDGGDWGSLYRAADEALGRAKEEGRNRVLAAQ
ncbi:MAG TPA: diguanylate cyclase [Gemmatimonadaceae bacterium]